MIVKGFENFGKERTNYLEWFKMDLFEIAFEFLIKEVLH